MKRKAFILGLGIVLGLFFTALAGTTPGSAFVQNIVDLTTTVTGTLPVANGGTGAGTLTSNGVVIGNGTSAVTITAEGATNTVLHGNTGADPSFSSIVNADITNTTIDLTAKVTGTLPTANGGTNKSSNYAVGDVVYASGTTTLAGLADVATGQVLISGGVNTAPAWSSTPTVASILLGGPSGAGTALSDYEEGSWTPTWVSSGGGAPGYNATTAGRYTIVGNRVLLYAYIYLDNLGTLAAGNMTIGGLPVAASGGATYCAVHLDYFSGVTLVAGGYSSFGPYIAASGTSVDVFCVGTGLTATRLTKACLGTSAEITFTGVYQR